MDISSFSQFYQIPTPVPFQDGISVLCFCGMKKQSFGDLAVLFDYDTLPAEETLLILRLLVHRWRKIITHHYIL